MKKELQKYDKLENGRMNPTLSTLEKIVGALACPSCGGGISSSELLK